MRSRRFAGRVFLMILGGLVMTGAMGSRCSIPFPLPIPPDPMVTVELVNTTAYPIDPFLYVHPDENIPFALLIDEFNLLILDPLLQPGEVVTLGYECEDIGAAVPDRPVMFVGPDAFEADNSPVVRWGRDFLCGDIISFIFIDDIDTGEFFTRVEINDEFLTDTD